jgi:hypothetical protein
MQLYLGAEGPGWAAQYVNRDGASVLVVSVEPPHSGDRIFTLRKEFARYRAGTVFVRRQGSTVQAGPDDIRALEDRFAADAAEAVARARRLRDLREIGGLIERIISQAKEPANSSAWWRDPRWICEEQRLLALLLASFDHPMPKCRQAAKAVLATTRDAREEVMAALKDIHACDSGT